MIVHGIPGPYRLKRGDIISIDVGVTLDGWVADAARTFPVGEIDADRPEPAERHRGVAARRRRAVPRRQPHGRRLARDPARRRGRRAVGRALARRARGRAQHARGPAGAQLRQARQGPAARGGHGARDRADDDRRAARRCASPATAGRSSPRTARWRRTSSSRSRSPREGPRILTPWHLPPGERPRSGSPRPPGAPADGRPCIRAPARAQIAGVATIRSPARTRGVCARESISTTR